MTETAVRSVTRFPMGQLVWTRGVNDLVAGSAKFAKGVLDGLRRHGRGDWGELCAEDKRLNDESVVSGERLLSSYEAKGTKFWIITEADRSATKVRAAVDWARTENADGVDGKQPVEFEHVADPSNYYYSSLDQAMGAAAWAYDRLAGIKPLGRGSMVRKVRRMLGYSVPR